MDDYYDDDFTHDMIMSATAEEIPYIIERNPQYQQALKTGLKKIKNKESRFSTCEIYAISANVASKIVKCGKIVAWDMDQYAKVLAEYESDMFRGRVYEPIRPIFDFRLTPVEVMAKRITTWKGEQHRMLFREHALCFLATIIIANMTDLIATYKREIAKRKKSITKYIIEFCYQWFYTRWITQRERDSYKWNDDDNRLRAGGRTAVIKRAINIIADRKCKYKLLMTLINHMTHNEAYVLGCVYDRIAQNDDIIDLCVNLGYRVPYYRFSCQILMRYPHARDMCVLKCKIPHYYTDYSGNYMHQAQSLLKHRMFGSFTHAQCMDFLTWMMSA